MLAAEHCTDVVRWVESLCVQAVAVRAVNYLWQSRHRTSDLVGTVINIHNGDWVRRGMLSVSLYV